MDLTKLEQQIVIGAMDILRKEAEKVVANWNGEHGGIAEEKASIALDFLKSLMETTALMEELNI
jgi:hypothetical protein